MLKKKEEHVSQRKEERDTSEADDNMEEGKCNKN